MKRSHPFSIESSSFDEFLRNVSIDKIFFYFLQTERSIQRIVKLTALMCFFIQYGENVSLNLITIFDGEISVNVRYAEKVLFSSDVRGEVDLFYPILFDSSQIISCFI